MEHWVVRQFIPSLELKRVDHRRNSCAAAQNRYYPRMKCLMAIIAYLVVSLFLGWGILLAMKGNPWLLIIGFLVYAVAFAKIGCLPGKSH